MEVLWFTKNFHINLFFDSKDYSSILKIRKLRPRNINLLIVTQVEESQFESRFSYSYFQSMERLGKGGGGGNFLVVGNWKVSEQDKLSGPLKAGT